MNLSEANAVLPFIHLLGRNQRGSSYHLLVPGHNGHRYHVYVKVESGTFTVECQQEMGSLGQRPCQGNSSSLCYHAIAGVKWVLRAWNRENFWSSKLDNLRRLRRTGGLLHRVVSKTSKKEVYVLERMKGR